MALRRCKTCHTPLGNRLVCASCFANALETEHRFSAALPAIVTNDESVRLDLDDTEHLEIDDDGAPILEEFSAIPRSGEMPLDFALSGPAIATKAKKRKQRKKRRKEATKGAALQLAEPEQPAPKPKPKPRRKRLKRAALAAAAAGTSRSAMSSLGGALLVHAVALFIFSLIFFDLMPQFIQPSVARLRFAEAHEIELDDGEQDKTPVVTKNREAEPENTESDIISAEAVDLKDMTPDELIHQAPVEFPEMAPEPRELGPRVPDSGLQGRPSSARKSHSRKAEAARKYGGGRAELTAVEMALAFLSGHQLEDGSWNVTGARYPRSSKTLIPLIDAGTYEGYDIGVSSLAIMAFLGADYTIDSEQYGEVVQKGLRWLLRQQQADGSFDQAGTADDGAHVYNSALGFLVMAEAAAKHPNELVYRTATRKAMDFFRTYQNLNGGWSYYSGQRYLGRKMIDGRSDGSISGWVAFAAYTAQEAGITVDKKMLENTVFTFDYLADHKTGETRYADTEPHPDRRGIAMTAIGLTVRRLLAPEQFVQTDRLALDRLLQKVPKWDDLLAPHVSTAEPNFASFYAWYYGGLGAFFATGGQSPEWTKWNEAMKEALVPTQVSSGNLRGSWDPVESWLGEGMGRLYTTALGCLTLEVYYRHEPREKYRLPAR